MACYRPLHMLFQAVSYDRLLHMLFQAVSYAACMLTRAAS